MSYSLAQMREMSDEQLIREHDQHAAHTVVGTQYYLDELRHRDLERMSSASERLSRQAVLLTLVNTILAVIATVAAIIALAR